MSTSQPSHPPPATTTTTTTTTTITTNPPSSSSSSSPSNQKHPPSILLALSGPTSSGKTTIATALRSILPPSTSLTIHADDFYKPDSQIPLKNGIQDWDCADSLDLVKFERVLRTIKEGSGGAEEVLGALLRQGNFDNGNGNEDEHKHDGVHGAINGIPPQTLERVKSSVQNWIGPLLRGRQLVVVDGFLLFGTSIPASFQDLFDIKILLRARYEDAKRRREQRNGYVTLEGFWEDPEGYFDQVVWPNYVVEYGGLMGGEGEEGEGEGEKKGIRLSDSEWGLEECLEWVVGVLRREIE